jgi:hypothetical protein
MIDWHVASSVNISDYVGLFVLYAQPLVLNVSAISGGIDALSKRGAVEDATGNATIVLAVIVY